MLIIMLFIVASCYAQGKKDALIPGKRDSLVAQKKYSEKKDTSFLRMQQFFRASNIMFSINGMSYFAKRSEESIKEELERIAKPPGELLQKNIDYMMSNISRALKDKRSGFQKFLEDFLGIMEKVAAVVLAAKVLLK